MGQEPRGRPQDRGRQRRAGRSERGTEGRHGAGDAGDAPLAVQHVRNASLGDDGVVTLEPLVLVLPDEARVVATLQGPLVVDHRKQGVPGLGRVAGGGGHDPVPTRDHSPHRAAAQEHTLLGDGSARRRGTGPPGGRCRRSTLPAAATRRRGKGGPHRDAGGGRPPPDRGSVAARQEAGQRPRASKPGRCPPHAASPGRRRWASREAPGAIRARDARRRTRSHSLVIVTETVHRLLVLSVHPALLAVTNSASSGSIKTIH